MENDLSVRQVAGAGRWGDCAWIRNARDVTIAPPTARFAIQEARCLADKLLAAIHEEPTKSLRYRPRGSMAAIGHRHAVAELRGVPLWGLCRLAHVARVLLSRMPTIGRKVRILLEWSRAASFRTDITHLRFHRSVDLQPPAAVSAASHTASR